MVRDSGSYGKQLRKRSKQHEDQRCPVVNALQVIPSTQVELRWSGQRLAIVPRTPLLPGQEYAVVLGSAALDQAGTALSPELRLSFTTVSAGLTARTIV